MLMLSGAAQFLICHLQLYSTAGRINTHPPSGSIFEQSRNFLVLHFSLPTIILLTVYWCHGFIIHWTQLRFEVQKYGVFWCSHFLVLTISKTPNQFSFCYFLLMLVDLLGITFLEVSVSAEGFGEMLCVALHCPFPPPPKLYVKKDIV